MSEFDVHPDEMRGHPTIDDDTAEALLAGRVPQDRPELGALAAVIADLRASGEGAPEPIPGAALAELLTVGLATDKGDPAATPASNAHGPAETQVAGLPNWRRRGMVATMLGTAAGKVAIACAAAVTAVGGVAWADGLPASAQNVVSHAAGTVGIELPSHDDAPGHGSSGDHQDTNPSTPGADTEHAPPAGPATGGSEPTATTEPSERGGAAVEHGDGGGEPVVGPGTGDSSGDHHDGEGAATTPTTEAHQGDDGEHPGATTTTTAPHEGDGGHASGDGQP